MKYNSHPLARNVLNKTFDFFFSVYKCLHRHKQKGSLLKCTLKETVAIIGHWNLLPYVLQ